MEIVALKLLFFYNFGHFLHPFFLLAYQPNIIRNQFL
jgi:hypothetical protein